MQKTERITLPDGRTLAFCEFGDRRGRPIFFAHGGPGSRLNGGVLDQAAAKYGIRLISSDRPGMGQSTFLPDRRLLDYPKDIAALADALEIGEFGVMGWSGGGAHTTVCGYALADRLRVNFPLCGFTNLSETSDADGVLTDADRRMAKMSLEYPRLFGLSFQLMRLGLRYIPGTLHKSLVSSAPEADRPIFEDPEFWQMMREALAEAFVQGPRGVVVDTRVHFVDWGIKISEIPGKVHVFHGTEDQTVLFAQGQHLAANLPNCEFHIMEGQGHLFGISHQEMIFELAEAEFAAA